MFPVQVNKIRVHCCAAHHYSASSFKCFWLSAKNVYSCLAQLYYGFQLLLMLFFYEHILFDGSRIFVHSDKIQRNKVTYFHKYRQKSQYHRSTCNRLHHHGMFHYFDKDHCHTHQNFLQKNIRVRKLSISKEVKFASLGPHRINSKRGGRHCS